MRGRGDKVKIGHIADLHLGAGTAFGAFDPVTGLNTFTLEQLVAARAAIDQTSEAECDYLLIVGDVFDYPNPSMKLNHAFQDLLDYAIDKNLVVIVKTGNHEKEDDRTDALLALFRESDPNYQYIGHGRSYATPEGIVFADQDVEMPEAIYHIGLYHGIIEGALAGGFKLEAPPVVVAKSVKLLLLGDVHMAQDGKYKNVPYYYPGSLVRLNFGEKDYSPSFGICTIDTEAMMQHTYERISMAGYSRQFYDLECSDVDYAVDTGADLVPPRSIVKVTGPATGRAVAERLIKECDGILYKYITVEKSGTDAASELPKSNEFNVRKVIAALPMSQPTKDLLLSMTTEEEFTGIVGQWRLDSIVMEGFGSYGPTALLLPKEDSAIQIVGKVGESEINSNGAGKSLITDAIRVALYGTTYRGLSTGWIVNGPIATVNVTLRQADHTVQIVRTIEKGTGPGKQTIKAFVDGVEYTQDRIGDTQTFIQRLLGVSDATFEICTMIGKEGLSLVDKSSAYRVEYMVDLFKMGDVDKIADFVNQQEAESKQRVFQVAGSLSQVTEQLNQLTAAVIQQPNPFALAAAESKKAEADRNIGGWQQSMSTFDQQNRDIDTLNNVLVQAVQTANAHELRIGRELHELNQALDRATAALNEGVLMRNGGPRNCPKCGAIMDDLHVSAHVEELDHEVAAAQERVREKEIVHEEAVKAVVAATKKQVDGIKPHLGAAEKENADKQIAAWQVVSNASASDIQNHRAIASAHEQHQLKIQMVTSTYLDVEMLLADANGQMAYWAYVKKHFNAPKIKEQVCTTVKNYLNETASYYLSRIFGPSVGVLCDVSIQHTKTKDNLKFEIYVLRNQGKVPIEQYSKGEKASVRVAVDLAVSLLVSSVCPAQFMFVILDEAMDGLDPAKASAIADLMKDLVASRGTAFMVSHTKAGAAMKFDHTIQVEKVGDVSKAVLI